MTKIALKFAELHTPLFLAGTNLGLKLNPRERKGLEIEYDRAEKELWVHWNGGMAIVPSTNVASMTLWQADAALLTTDKIGLDSGAAILGARDVEVVPLPLITKTKVSAQVSTPTSHVFEGPGAGKS
jgi:hypothetical protein